MFFQPKGCFWGITSIWKVLWVFTSVPIHFWFCKRGVDSWRNLKPQTKTIFVRMTSLPKTDGGCKSEWKYQCCRLLAFLGYRRPPTSSWKMANLIRRVWILMWRKKKNLIAPFNIEKLETICQPFEPHNLYDFECRTTGYFSCQNLMIPGLFCSGLQSIPPTNTHGAQPPIGLDLPPLQTDRLRSSLCNDCQHIVSLYYKTLHSAYIGKTSQVIYIYKPLHKANIEEKNNETHMFLRFPMLFKPGFNSNTWSTRSECQARKCQWHLQTAKGFRPILYTKNSKKSWKNKVFLVCMENKRTLQCMVLGQNPYRSLVKVLVKYGFGPQPATVA